MDMPDARREPSDSQDEANAHTTRARQHRPGLTLLILALLFGLAFVDRFIPAGMKDLYKKDLQLTDLQAGIPSTVFVLVLVATSPVFGYLSDKGWNRKGLLTTAVVVWSIGTLLTGLSEDFVQFVLARAIVGVGEAAYTTVGLTLLADSFPAAKRNQMLSTFLLSVPIGAAIGFIVGGTLGPRIGWRSTFLVCGGPGLFLAGLLYFVEDPGRGLFDEPTHRDGAEPANPSWSSSLWELPYNRIYVCAVLGQVLQTFGVGGLADWMPTFIQRRGSINFAAASSGFGLSTVISGIAGTKVGGIIADHWFAKNTRQPYLAISGLSLFPAALIIWISIATTDAVAMIVLSFIYKFFFFMHNAPLNALIANSVPARLRARAFALASVLTHGFGDAISPSIIGAISDATGSLPLAMSVIPVTIALAGSVWLWGWRHLPEPTWGRALLPTARKRHWIAWMRRHYGSMETKV